MTAPPSQDPQQPWSQPQQPYPPYPPVPPMHGQPIPRTGGAGKAVKVVGAIVVLLLVFVVGVAVGAAGSDDKGDPQAGGSLKPGTNRPSSNAPAATEEATTRPAPSTSAPSKSKNPKFEETYRWKDGVEVTVNAPTPYEKANQYIDQPIGTSGISMIVTIVNHSADNYDPTFFHATMQSGNAEAEQIFDSAGGLGGSPSTTLLPEREATFSIGFWVTNPADLVLEVTPGFEYDKAIYTS